MTLRDLYFLVVIGLIRGTPRAAQAFTARVLAYAAYVFSRGKRGRMEQSIAVAFRGISERRIKEIVLGALGGVWEEMFAWALPPLDLNTAQIEGLEHLRASLARRRGVILWESNGFGRRILAKRLLHAEGFALHQIHGPRALGGFQANPTAAASWVRTHWVRPFFDQREIQFAAELIYLPSDDSLAFTRTLAARLRSNAILCVSGDGREGQKLVTLPFLGQRVLFAPGMVSLARLTGASIHPLFCMQQANGKLVLRVAPPLDLERDALAQYAKLLEARIRAQPELYRNWHLVGDDGESVLTQTARSSQYDS